MSNLAHKTSILWRQIPFGRITTTSKLRQRLSILSCKIPLKTIGVYACVQTSVDDDDDGDNDDDDDELIKLINLVPNSL